MGWIEWIILDQLHGQDTDSLPIVERTYYFGC